jgi:hypothetical protein
MYSFIILFHTLLLLMVGALQLSESSVFHLKALLIKAFLVAVDRPIFDSDMPVILWR